MPNLALYAKPDGPFGNPADLLPMGKIDEARAAQEEAALSCTRDMVYISTRMADVGAVAPHLPLVHQTREAAGPRKDPQDGIHL